MSADTFSVAERPWRQTPDTSHLAQFPSDRLEARADNSLLGGCRRGGGATEPGVGPCLQSSACIPRHQPAFLPDPAPDAADAPSSRSVAAPPSLERCRRTAHAVVRGGDLSARAVGGGGGAAAAAERWGLLGGLVAKLVEQQSFAGSIIFEHWALSLLSRLLDRVARRALDAFAPSSAAAARARAATAAAPPAAAAAASAAAAAGAQPCVEWHPHRDLLATLSTRGSVAVHAVEDGLRSSSTQYLHCDGALGAPQCLAWQPNDLRGSLAVGASDGLAVWRSSQARGWERAFSAPGAAFACPALAWSPSGRSLAAAGARGVVRVWPHGKLSSLCPDPWCVTLRRWRSGPATGVRWSPDGALLAVAHSGRQPFVRFWSTASWEIALHVNLMSSVGETRGGLAAPAPSLAWCSEDTMLGVAAGQLFELRGASSGSGSGFASGFEPACRTLQLPAAPAPAPAAGLGGGGGGGGGASAASGAAAAAGGGGQQAAEVCVCARTGRFVAVRVADAARVLVFERRGDEGWMKQELTLWGFVGPDDHDQPFGSPRSPEGLASAARRRPIARAVAFAADSSRGGGRRVSSAERSVLSVYWEFSDGSPSEVKTYSMHHVRCMFSQATAEADRFEAGEES